MPPLRSVYERNGINAGLPFGGSRRHTLKSAIDCVGRGLHSGAEVHLRLVPAAPDTGIVFHRKDLDVKIPASYDHVTDTRLCTVVTSKDHPEVSVGTIEHLTAALAASQIDDILIEVDAPELPILDGSAAPFMFLIQSAGIIEHDGVRNVIEILRPVRAARGDAFAELRPHGINGFANGGLDLSLAISFSTPAIGRQAFSLHLTHDSFAEELAAARTFTLAAEIEALRAAGLAKGGSLSNAIVVDDSKVLNPEGLRWQDEFVRHKLLDVIGDLALAGGSISGRFIGNRTGHALNNLLLRELFSNTANYRLAGAAIAASQPMPAAA